MLEQAKMAAGGARSGDSSVCSAAPIDLASASLDFAYAAVTVVSAALPAAPVLRGPRRLIKLVRLAGRGWFHASLCALNSHHSSLMVVIEVARLVLLVSGRIRIATIDRVRVSDLAFRTVDDYLAAPWCSVQVRFRSRFGGSLRGPDEARALSSLSLVLPLPIRSLRHVSSLCHTASDESNVCTCRMLRLRVDASHSEPGATRSAAPVAIRRARRDREDHRPCRPL